jgi:hypothetical protein
VVWDREGEEGMRVIQRKGMGWEGRKGRERREGKGRKEGRRKMTCPPPPKKFLDPPLRVPLYPLPKKFLCGFVRIPGVILEASGGFKPPRGLATV